jgi:AAA domain
LSERQDGKKNTLRIGSAAELRGKKFPALKYIVPEILAEGCTLIAGRPKLGKSWLMLDIGIAVAAGRYCLGENKCEQGDVLYLALEDNERRLQRRRPRSAGRLGNRLPPDPELRADLCAPTWKLGARGILLESKDGSSGFGNLRQRLGRSPGKGDAVVMAWSEGNAAAVTRHNRAGMPLSFALV